MPELLQSLLKQDIGHLRIIAEFWGVELESITVDDAREELSAALLDVDLISELVESLSPQSQSALRALVEAEGRIPWVVFTVRPFPPERMPSMRRMPGMFMR